MNEIDKKKTLNLHSGLNEVFGTLSHRVDYSGVEPLNPQAVKTLTGKLDGENLTLVQSL